MGGLSHVSGPHGPTTRAARRGKGADMAEEMQGAAAEPTATEPHGTGQEGAETVSKAEYDKLLAQSRKWEQRSKDNAAKAYEAKAERAAIVAEVAEEKGVDADWLSRMAGATREEVEANADYIASKLAGKPIYPSVTDNGQRKTPPITKEQIEAIKDPCKRIKVRAQHLDLYK